MSERPQIFSNERAIANAGSGKTYTIVSRFIALSMRDDCSPEQICALTFTRMSAAEFLDKILQRLAAASRDDAAAAELSGELRELGLTKNFTRDDFRAHLKKVASLLPRLKLTTIDAFEAAFASAFANELGVFSAVKVMDKFEKDNARKSSAIFALESVGASRKTRDAFLAEVAKASYGANNKLVLKKIESFIADAEPFLSEIPNLSKWGGAENFDFSVRPREWNEAAYAAECAALEKALAGKKSFLPLHAFFANSRIGKIGGITKITESFSDWMREGKRIGDFFYENPRKRKNPEKEILPPAAEKPLRNLADMLIGGVLKASLDSASAIGYITKLYENEYFARVKSKGRLDFSDFASLLSAGENSFARELVEYRLDARFKHWLLDEFQDTSLEQWKALGNLMDEVICDESGERTLFYVGDKKQSIYGWRGADSSLFDVIFDRYNPRIRGHKPLAESYRSTKPVIEAVNLLFSPPKGEGGCSDSLLCKFNGEAANDWRKSWETHLVAPPKNEYERGLKEIGCVALVDSAADNFSRAEKIYAIIEKIYAENPDFTCAVLTQKNDTAVEILDAMRELSAEKIRRGETVNFTFSGELDIPVAVDNMANTAILSAMDFAFHPLETASGKFAAMTPLKALFGRECWREEVLKIASENGFEGAVLHMSEIFAANAGGVSDFERGRMEELVGIARNFDASDSSGVDEFLEFARRFRKRESSKKSSVTVMTIHKSKGLTFDITVLPDLQNARGMPSSVRLKILENAKGERAVLNMPPKEICAFDKTLWNAVLNDERKKAFDLFCKFYVACTRPKYALYLFADFAKEYNGKNKYSFEDLAKETFSTDNKSSHFDGVDMSVAFGRDDWYVAKTKLDKRFKASRDAADNSSAQGGSGCASIATLENPALAFVPKWSVAPSAKTRADEDSDDLNSLSAREAGMSFGSLAHLMLSKIKRLSDFPQALSGFEGRPDFTAMKDYLARNFAKADFAKYFEPAENVEVLTEYPFAFYDGEGVVSGVIDRLMLEKNADGKIVGAKIIDYKTGNLPPDKLAEKYGGQLALYRKAISRAYGLPASAVECVALGLQAEGLF